MEDGLNRGIVYVLSNPAMEGYLKIGKTGGDSVKDVLDRMRQLDTTGVPRAFECEHAAVVDNYEQVEKKLHEAFEDRRVRKNREFFEGLSPSQVKAVLSLLVIKEVTPSEDEIKQIADPNGTERPPRRLHFRFSMVEISIGEQLDWVDDPENVKCIVVSNDRVEYQGEIYSMSGLASQLRGGGSLQGTRYWLYQGETLQDRRIRYETQELEEED